MERRKHQMITRMIVPAILSAIMLSTPVLAANQDPSHDASKAVVERNMERADAAKCIRLENQVDRAIEAHKTAANLNEVKTMRAEGGNLCATGKQADGIAKLEQALQDLRAKATS